MDIDITHQEKRPKSNFVTVIAWLSIVIAVYYLLASGSQLATTISMMNTTAYNDAINAYYDNLPSYYAFYLQNLYLIYGLLVVFSLLALIAPITLLIRKNWGRYLYIGILMGVMLVEGGGWVMQHNMTKYVESNFEKDSTESIVDDAIALTGIDTETCCDNKATNNETFSMQDDAKFMLRVFTIVNALFVIGVILFCIWLSWRLTRPDIVAEFVFTEASISNKKGETGK